MIFLSAGHHERAQGASFEGITEYVLATIWSNKIKEILGDRATRVPNGTLKEKVGFINDHCDKNDVAVEIHFNSFKIWKDANENGLIDDGELKAAGRGSETLYFPSSVTGKEAARVVQGSLAQIMKPDRGIKEGWFRLNKSRGADFFLARTKCNKSLIIEPEFIDNQEIISQNMDTACHAIASALLEIDE